MTMAVILSLCLTLIEGARSSAICLESQIVSDIAVNSLLAEYHRELFDQYNILAIDDSYGGDKASLDNTESHLRNYIERNMEKEYLFLSSLLYRDFIELRMESAEIEGVLYLTDEGGSIFRRRAYEALKTDLSVTLVSEISEYVKYINDRGLEDIKPEDIISTTDDEVKDSLDTMSEDVDEVMEVEDTGGSMLSVPVTNPLSVVTSALEEGLSEILLNDEYDVSDYSVDPEKLFTNRKKSGLINSGNMKLEDGDCPEIFEQLAFQEYLFRYMGSYRNEDDDNALKYQIEYIISGKESDKDNLDSIIARIFAIRFAEDYAYIFSDESKCDTAYKLAVLISVFTYTEENIDEYKQLILFTWSFAEAAYDTKLILSGREVPLIKTSENWMTNVMEAMNGSVLVNDVPDVDSGIEAGGEDILKADSSAKLDYEGYLRIFMLMMDQRVVTERAMDIVESDIRLTSGNSNFRIDACIDTFQTKIKTTSSFGYHYEFVLKRRYE